MAVKSGAKFDDDIITQVVFVDELDSVFGASARTSLQGDVEKAATIAGQAVRGDKLGAAVSTTKASINKLRGINRDNQYRAILELLK